MKKILIIEDDLVVAQTYHSKLTSEGFQTALAMDGDDGLALAATFLPDLVVMDLMLPGINGLEVLGQLRSDSKLAKTPVLFLSSHAVEAGTRLERAAGLNRSLVKAETSPSKMVQVIQEMLSQRERVRSNPVQVAREQFCSDVDKAVVTMGLAVRSLTGISETDSDAYSELESRSAGITYLATELGLTRMASLSAAIGELAQHLVNWPYHATVSTAQTFLGAFAVLGELSRTNNPEGVLASLALLVEDDPITQKVMQSALEKSFVRAVATTTGEAALDLSEQNRFDLILLDYKLPGMDGAKVCRELRKNPDYATTPIVFITSLQDFQIMDQLMNEGANDLIAKPVMLAELSLKALTHLLKAH